MTANIKKIILTINYELLYSPTLTLFSLKKNTFHINLFVNLVHFYFELSIFN